MSNQIFCRKMYFFINLRCDMGYYRHNNVNPFFFNISNHSHMTAVTFDILDTSTKFQLNWYSTFLENQRRMLK